MLTRRFILAGVGAPFLLPQAALAQDGRFPWRRPGYEPLVGTSEEQAHNLLLTSELVPMEIATQLRSKVAARQFSTEEISEGSEYTRMLFGRGIVVGNVVAVTTTEEWAAMRNSGRAVKDVYKVRDGGTKRVYSISRPHPCGNWCLAIFDTFGKCVEDALLCDAQCERLRKAQFQR